MSFFPIMQIDKFVESITRERAWRVKELLDIRDTLNPNSPNSAKRKILTRSAVKLSYAHWEGYIKRSGDIFLKYLNSNKFDISDIQPHLISLHFKTEFDQAKESKKFLTFTKQIQKFFDSKDTYFFNVPSSAFVDTKSNLSSVQMKHIVECLGLDFRFFELKQNFIDSVLIENRNAVVHGEYRNIEKTEATAIISAVLEMIEHFQQQLEHAVYTRSYLISS